MTQKPESTVNNKQREALFALAKYSRLNSGLLCEVTSFSSLRRSQEALKALYEAKLVNRVSFYPLHADAGRTEYVYSLTQKGVEEITLKDNKKRKGSRKPRKTGFQLAHILALNRFRIDLEKACSLDSDIVLEDLIPEYHGERGILKVPRRRVQEQFRAEYSPPKSFIPDIAFVLSLGTEKSLFFSEIDLDYESFKLLAEKVADYSNFLESEGFSHYSDEFNFQFTGFRLLFVMSENRIETLFDSINEMDIDTGFVWATDRRWINPHSFFEPIWLVADRDLSQKFSLLE